MPCGDGGVPYPPDPYEKEAVPNLCWILRELQKEGSIDFYLEKNPRLEQWWLEHVRRDNEEMERQKYKERLKKARNSALSKLTKAERAALGLNAD